jgi:hypothetical protein
LAAFVLDREQCTRVAGRDLSRLNQLSNCGGKAEHSQEVGDRRAVLSYRLRDLLLREPKLGNQPLKPLGFLEWIEVCTLEVLDEGEGEHRTIVEVSDDGWHVSPSELRDGAESPLTGDELPAASGANPDHDGLQQSAGSNGLHQFGEL